MGALIVADRPLAVRLMYHMVDWWSSIGADAITKLISYAFLWIIPYQIGFDIEVTFDWTCPPRDSNHLGLALGLGLGLGSG